MKYIPSIAFEEMSGSAKGVTAAKTMGRKYIRNKGYGGGVRTAAQAAVKSVFKQLSQGWKSLTNEQILAWTSLAQSQAGRSVLGTSSKITGSNLYMRLNYWIVYCGGEALTHGRPEARHHGQRSPVQRRHPRLLQGRRHRHPEGSGQR